MIPSSTRHADPRRLPLLLVASTLALLAMGGAAGAVLLGGIPYQWHGGGPVVRAVLLAANSGAALTYFVIAGLMLRGLLRPHAAGASNALGIAACLIFVTCGMGHLAHAGLVVGSGHGGLLAGLLITADIAAFAVAASFLALRERYTLITGGEAALVDLQDRLAERQQAEAAIREREERFRAMFEYAATGMALVGLDGRFHKVNAALCAITGYSAAELTNLSFPDITHPDDLQEDLTQAAALLAGESTSYQMEKRYICKDGATVWVRLTVALARSFSGEPREYTTVVEDITVRRRAETERAAALARSEADSRAKDEFLSIVSHELRTPLTPLLAWSSMLQSSTITPARAAEGLAAIERSARTQARLIEDLLDVSRIVSGKLALELEPAELNEAVRAAIDAVRPAALDKGVVLVAELEPRGAPLQGDPVRLQQIVANLLTNAVKFTPAGGRAVVRLAREGGSIRLTVRDTGQGIEPAFLPYVFERFRQADSSTTRMQGGLGLGLAIVRHLVEAHGGYVTAASGGRGKGATFTVILPASLPAPVAGPLPASPPPARLAGMRLLVVEDQADTRAALCAMLEAGGAQVSAVATAEEALAILSARPHDGLLSDIALPGADGYSLIRQMQHLPGAAEMPAVALTAFADSSVRSRALAAGFHACLTKPVAATELVAALAALCG